MNLLPPLPGDDKRAEDILDEIHVIFTRTGCRMRYTKPRWRIDSHPGVRHELPVAGIRPQVQRKHSYLGAFGVWTPIAEFVPETGRWSILRDQEMATAIVQGMLLVIAKHKAHLVMNQANREKPTWLLCIANEFGEYRMIAELSQITPKRYDWRPLSPQSVAVQ